MAMDEERSPEAIAIIGKLRKKRGYGGGDEGGDDESDSSDSGSAGEEAFTSAAEDLFRLFKGRDPKESETDELKDITRRLIANCDDSDEDDQ